MTPGLEPDESGRLNALWAVADRAGLHRVSSNLEAALKEYETALDHKRAVKATVDQAEADYADAAGLAELIAARQVTREGNKTFVPDPESEGGRRQVTADEAKQWIARAVAADPEVAAAARQMGATKVALEEATDRIAVAERRIQTTKHATDAAVALTTLLAVAFNERTTR